MIAPASITTDSGFGDEPTLGVVLGHRRHAIEEVGRKLLTLMEKRKNSGLCPSSRGRGISVGRVYVFLDVFLDAQMRGANSESTAF